jgi:MFS family permease
MPSTPASTSTAAPASLIDSPQAAWRLLITLGLVVLGNSSMYVVSVVLPAVQAEFGVGRADASLPYTLMMVCLGIGGLWTGRMADRHGLMPVLCVGAVGVCGGFVWAGLSGSIWGFGLAHGLMGLIGASATFAPLLADTALWWNRRRGIAVAICASGNYIAGALWPPIVQHGIESIGWRHTYVLMGLVCGVGMLLLALRMRQRAPMVLLDVSAVPASASPGAAQRRFPRLWRWTAAARLACARCTRSCCCVGRVWRAAWPWRCRRCTSWPIAPTWVLARRVAPKCCR